MRMRPFTILTACILLAGCNSFDVREKLGLEHKAPDEFQVYSRPPLSVPPEFNLRPPGQASSAYVASLAAEDQAHHAILSNDDTATSPSPSAAPSPFASPLTGPSATAVPFVSSNALPTGGDAQFLADIGGVKADPHIRQELLDEKLNGQGAQDSHYLFGGKEQADSTVDAAKEAQRIKDDKAQNKPVTTGDTPAVQPADKGLLGDIF